MKKLIISLTLLFGVLGFAFVGPVSAQQGSTQAACEGVGLVGGSGCTEGGGPTVNSTIRTAISILSFIVGVAAVIMIIIGGFKYVISQGDSGNVNNAKNTILYAVIGLVVALLAQVIVRFVLRETTQPTAYLDVQSVVVAVGKTFMV